MNLKLRKKRDDVITGASQEHAGTETQGISTGEVPQESTPGERKSWFDSVQNETQGHLGLHATLRVLQDRQWVWPRMSRDVAGWIGVCGRNKETVKKNSSFSFHAPIGLFHYS